MRVHTHTLSGGCGHTAFSLSLAQAACAWSAHQDHRQKRSHCGCVQEEMNNVSLPLPMIVVYKILSNSKN